MATDPISGLQPGLAATIVRLQPSAAAVRRLGATANRFTHPAIGRSTDPAILSS